VGGVQITTADVARAILRSVAAPEPRPSAVARGPAATLQQPQYAQFEHCAQQPSSGCSAEMLASGRVEDCEARIPLLAAWEVLSQMQANEFWKATHAAIIETTRSSRPPRSFSNNDFLVA